MFMNMINETPKHELQFNNVLFLKTNYLLPSIVNTSNGIIIFCIGNVIFDVQLQQSQVLKQSMHI